MSLSSSHVKICVYSAAKELGRYHAAEVRIPAFDGEMGIFAGHTHIGGAMTVGVVHFVSSGAQGSTQNQCQSYFVTGGFFEMRDNVLTLLVNVWEEASEVDMSRAQESKNRAISRLEAAHRDVNVSRALDALKRAEMRLAVAQPRKRA